MVLFELHTTTFSVAFSNKYQKKNANLSYLGLRSFWQE